MAEHRKELLRALAAESRRSATTGLDFVQAIAERSGMSLTDLQCVTILAETGPITAGRLAEEMRLTTGAITGVVNRMERAGYVRREKDPADGRRVVIRPIPEALERAGGYLFGSTERAMMALLAGYDDRDLAVILDFARRTNALTEAETARIRAASPGGDAGEFAAPLGAVERGRLVFANGAARLTLRAAGMGDLYRARFGETPPKVEAEGGVVTVRYPKRFFGRVDRRGQPGEVVLNAAVPWAIEVRGGAFELEADLGGLALTSFVCTQAQYRLDLTLPAPAGAVPIRLSAGASQARIRRPAGVAARVRVEGGVGTLSFDGQQVAAVGGTVRLESPGYAGAADRYEIEIAGGASEITIG
jgi:DNA-binding MarR family transcriptional regulator